MGLLDDPSLVFTEDRPIGSVVWLCSFPFCIDRAVAGIKGTGAGYCCAHTTQLLRHIESFPDMVMKRCLFIPGGMSDAQALAIKRHFMVILRSTKLDHLRPAPPVDSVQVV